MRAKPRFQALTALLVILTATVPVTAAEYDDCVVLAESASEITFRYTPGPLSWSADAEGEFPLIGKTTLRRESGWWAIPGRVLYLALPPGADAVDAAIVAAGAIESGSRTTLTAGQFPLERPEPVVVDEIFTLRGLRVARLILHPFIYTSASGDYEFTSELTVRVRFHGGRAGTALQGMAPSAFDAVMQSLCLNTTRVGEWRLPTRNALAKAAADPDPFAGSDDWIAIHITAGGVTRVTAADLQSAGVNLATTDPQSFRLFAGPGRQVSTTMSQPSPVLSEVAIRINGGEDGRFDAGDYFDFYAQALDRWEIANDTEFVDVVHRYDTENVYWLALSGSFGGSPKRVGSVPAPAPAPGAVDLFSATVRARHERNNLFRSSALGFIDSYYTWYWQNLQNSHLALFAVQGLESGTPAVIEVSSYWHSPALTMGGQPMDTLPRRPLGEDETRIARYRIPALTTSSDVQIAFPVSSRGYYVDYYSVEYQRRLTLTGGAFAFPLPFSDQAYAVTLAGVTSPEVWDVSDPETPSVYSDLVVTGNTLRVGVDQRDGSRHTLFALEPAQRRSPARLRRMTPPDLHTPAFGADYIVIGPRAFESALADFMSYRGGRDNLVMRYVAVEDIYDAFAFGMTDPVAIRRFLRHAYREWPGEPPVYALLVGDGNYDFLGYTGSTTANLLPPYIAIDDNSASDENFVYFGDRQVLDSDASGSENPFPDMIIGRWPVRTTGEIAAVTAKIKQYESNADLGPWRSRVVMVADDEFGDRNANSVTEVFHTRDAEEISRLFIPSRLDNRKIYMTEFPFDNPGCTNPSASGCRKPSVKEAIVDALNEGAAIFDYLGHGNKDLLAHERAFERVSDLPRLTNSGKPTAVLTFSCSIGFFDDPHSEGMSEEWLRMPDAGAVAVISATRLVTAGANAALNEKVFELLLSGEEPRIGVALYTGKLFRQYFARCTACSGDPNVPCPCPNDRRYVLFGDPAMRLGIPENRVVFSTVEPETLSALQLTEVSGRITDPGGSPIDDFDGTVSVIVRDAPRQRTYRINETISLEYDLAGGVLYRGNVPVESGRFSFGFVVPKDVAYGRRGAQVLGHAYSTDAMAGGVADSLWIAGSAGTLTDTAGPNMNLSTAGGELLNHGFLLPLGTELVVGLADASGINLTGSPGHGIEVFLDGSAEPLVDLTDAFTYAPGEFSRGEARFTLADVEPGAHELVLKAWDNANNSSRLALEVQVTEAGTGVDFRVDEFLNYPNPFDGSTRFFFTTTRNYTDATIRIFTLAGRLIRQLNGASDGAAEWNGVDQDGDPVGNGVYLAQVEVTGELNQNGQLVEKRAYKETKVVLSR
ncbi:MAG: type IX secretion system sortase PorU [Candidatus Zixiibacteriota bacterium]